MRCYISHSVVHNIGIVCFLSIGYLEEKAFFQTVARDYVNTLLTLHTCSVCSLVRKGAWGMGVEIGWETKSKRNHTYTLLVTKQGKYIFSFNKHGIATFRVQARDAFIHDS